MTDAELYNLVSPLLGTRYAPDKLTYDIEYSAWFEPLGPVSGDNAALIWQGHLVGQFFAEKRIMYGPLLCKFKGETPHYFILVRVGPPGAKGKYESYHSDKGPTLLHVLASAAVAVLAADTQQEQP